MPEYLAPGVYVEEVDTGSKPIEGVSTSTAGMIGVTERGPVNVPILITSYGEYTRSFGEQLNRLDFSNANGDHCYLPQAVEGFFLNGGKRVFIMRVLDETGAARSTFDVYDRGQSSSGNTVLLRAVGPNTGTAANPPLLVVLSGANLQQNDSIRVGDGSAAEYRLIALPPAPETVLVLLNFPLSRSHALTGPINVEQFTGAAAGGNLTLEGNVQRGDQVIEVTGASGDITGLVEDSLIQIGANANVAEHRFVHQRTLLSDVRIRVRLDSPLMMPYPNRTPVRRLTIPAATATAQLDPARAGESLIFVNNRGGDFDTRTDLIVINRTDNAAREVRRIGDLRQAAISPGAADVYSTGTLVENVSMTDGTAVTTLTEPSAAASNVITVGDVNGLSANQTLLVGPAAGPFDTVVIQSINQTTRQVTLTANLGSAKAINNLVIPLLITDPSGANTITASDVSTLSAGQTLLVGPPGSLETVVIQSINSATRVVTLRANLASPKNRGHLVIPVRALTDYLAAGTSIIALNNRMGLQVGDILRIGTNPDDEYAVISGLPNRAPAGVGPDAGNVILASPLVRNHTVVNTPVVRQNPVTTTSLQATVLALPAQAGENTMLLSDADGYAAGNFLRLTTPTGAFFHRVGAITPAPGNPGALAPQMITLNTPLNLAHSAGSAVAERRPLLTVQALDPGRWGNRLRVSIEDENPGLISQTSLVFVGLPTQIRLSSSAGVEPGTILEFLNPATSAPIGGLMKVGALNRATGEITLDGTGLDGPQQAAYAAATAAGTQLGVRSREFSLTIRLLRQPDPAMPSRNETVIDQESFRYLSLDPRHSRYMHRVIGTTWARGNPNDDDGRPLRRSDRRSEGESAYIRVRDLAPNQAIRLGPEPLVDLLTNGRRRPAHHPLSGGDDSISTLTDAHYIGVDNPNPENRTGLHTLRNIEEISIVAVPGRTSAQLQGGLITHCELMRYRFAVLDGPRPPADALVDVQAQRQQFDTKYAALYHPWLLVPDPFPTNLTQVAEYPIPPSGHIVGIYARTDIDRGVHKAPANEVVRGVIGLRRVLNKEQHDILNPYPVNINVIRDFRPNNRGIRVYGGRVITSDSDWKYVNVRRLLIFIEASIDRGLQWVVFEPNAEPLWARVRRSVTNFLNVVWRNGALEGTKPEEAFFVKCDRTTMTQTDIDNGRLICLIGVAPVKPAEFVIIRIGLWTAHAED